MAVILRQTQISFAQSARLAPSSALIHVVGKLRKPHCREHREGLAARLRNHCVAGNIATSQECRASLQQAWVAQRVLTHTPVTAALQQ